MKNSFVLFLFFSLILSILVISPTIYAFDDEGTLFFKSCLNGKSCEDASAVSDCREQHDAETSRRNQESSTCTQTVCKKIWDECTQIALAGGYPEPYDTCIEERYHPCPSDCYKKAGISEWWKQYSSGGPDYEAHKARLDELSDEFYKKCLSGDQELINAFNAWKSEWDEFIKERDDAVQKGKELCEKTKACQINCEGTDTSRCSLTCLDSGAISDGKNVCNSIREESLNLADKQDALKDKFGQLLQQKSSYDATNEPSINLDNLASQLQSTVSAQSGPSGSIFQPESAEPEDKKAEAKTAAEGKTLSAAAKARAERTFRPLFGRGPNDKPGIEVSSNGYPMGTFLAEQTEGQLILHAADELIFISNINNDATVIFEGVGVHKGEKIDFNWFDTGAQSAKTGSPAGFSASIRGAEGVASLSTTAETTETEFGELEWLSPSLTVEEDAPAGEHEVELVIEQGGEIISAIPFIIDVEEEEEAEGVSIVAYIIGLAVLAGAAYGGYYAYTKFVKKGKKRLR